MADREVSDELDYHITFPSPASPRYPEDDDEEFGEGDVGPTYAQSEPVVILLGWAGCQDKYLMKYSAVYEQRSCITIRYTAPLDAVFVNKPGRMENIAGKILELITELGLEENPIFFHIFSNGGGFVYQYISKHVNENPAYRGLQIKGCMLDSCPSQKRMLTAYRAFTSSQKAKYSDWIANLLGVFFLLFLIVNYVWQGVLKLLTVAVDSRQEYWYRMKDDPLHCPQLFLFSKADEIVNYLDIEEMISYRKSFGVHVESVCWDDSGHVAHMRKHRESYIKACYDFLDLCLNRN